ncbi:hypothetical protein [Bartonella sp. MR30HLJHH]
MIVHCKFYSTNHQIKKEDIDSFYSSQLKKDLHLSYSYR